MKKIYIASAISALIFASCKPSVNITTPPSAGNTDLRNYLAIGANMTAGYADSSLYVSSQFASIPKRLYDRFTLVTGVTGAKTSFIQPYLKTDNGFNYASDLTRVPKKVLSWVRHCNGDSSLSPIYYPGGYNLSDADYFTSPGANGQVNNIGVPGMRVADLPVAGYSSTLNMYAKRFFVGSSTTPMDELSYRVRNLEPTFFTLWLGFEDVLGFALAGGQGDGSMNAAVATGTTNYYNTNDITPATVFKTQYEAAVQVAISRGSQGILINLPDIERLPFFTALPIKGLYIPRQTLADSLTAMYAGYRYTFSLGYNNYIVKTHTGVLRQAVDGELLLMSCPIDSILCAGWGSTRPIPQEYVITTEELQNIRSATVIYNNFIRDMALRYNLPLSDMNTFMRTMSSSVVFNGITYNAQYLSGGSFSLDGVHPNPRGNALIANNIIGTINNFYKSSIPLMDANNYAGVLFP
ncbi:MAG: hypothetical protein EBX41_00390 [Chitinophagia bacterium]|nr:hypothetical protein [Chitinophagia bacterium]